MYGIAAFVCPGEYRGHLQGIAVGGKSFPELARPNLVSAAAPHAVAFAGNCFELLRADVRSVSGDSPAPDPVSGQGNDEKGPL